MPAALRDLTGQRFGRLEVIERREVGLNRVWHWECRCECGGMTVVRSDRLTRGVTRSCGCLKRQPRPVRPPNAKQRGYEVRAIDHDGRTTVLAYYRTRSQAEDHKVVIAHWRCVWIVKVHR